ncbi:MAG TPA: palindromic element RPE4 domain-containing protein [Rickettsia endosymbiont of Omalisus fontisbellaquei]|nr:palindromic element RPE4 domain-containing protein [Rickettsia endosymbiont of Omalisus fontisbellaquei]
MFLDTVDKPRYDISL